MICPNCHSRPGIKPDFVDLHDPSAKFCGVCRQAHQLVFTSIDDTRDSMRGVQDPAVLDVAELMERKSGRPRVSMLSLITRQRRKLAAGKGAS